MKAIRVSEFGGPEVLRLVDVEKPEPGPGQVRIAVRAAGVNPFDVKFRQGMFGTDDAPYTPGVDLAGVVDAAGEGARFAVGDEVFGTADGGSYAEYALGADLERKPASVSWELAAALPTVGEAASRTLRLLEVRRGETLLIHGAAGSVGSLATQLAVRRGVRVIGAALDDDLDTVRALGAEPVSSGDGLAERVRAIAPDGVDAALDTVGRGVLPVSIELAGGPARVITLADGDADKHGVRFTSGGDDRDDTALANVAELAADGELQLHIWRTYPLAEAASAHHDIEALRHRGKIILLM